MVKKIVSGAQTGVDRAALDAALESKFPLGGWCPSGRLAEDGPISDRYELKETPSADYAERTEWNVRDSDATLIITEGQPEGGTALTVEYANRWEKPFWVVDTANPNWKQEVEPVGAWLNERQVSILNVAGPRASKNAEIYQRAFHFIQSLLAKQVAIGYN